MRWSCLISWLLLLLAGMVGMPCEAQTQPLPQSKEQLAAYYYANGNYEQAIELYESLYGSTQNKYYYQYLLKAYKELGRTKDANKLVSKRMRKFPKEIDLHVDMALVYKLAGDDAKAEKEYAEAIASITGDSRQLETLVQALDDAGRTDLVIETYAQFRTRFHNPYAYVTEVAAAYARMNNYEGMTQEYFNLLDHSPKSMLSVQMSLQNALRQTASPKLKEGLQRTLIERVQQHPDNKVNLEMMIWFSLQQNDFEFAMTQARAVDARFPQQGAEQLLKVAQIALSGGDYEVARQCYQLIVEKGNTVAQYHESRLGVLKVQFVQLSRNFPLPMIQLANLKEQYEHALDELGHTPATAPMMRDYAQLLAYYIGDVQTASDVLYDVLEIPKLSEQKRCEVKLDLADLLLFAGEVWDASLLYMQVEKAYKNDALGAQAKFRNAQLSYYNGDFEWAQSQLNVLRSSTSKLIANDAMQLSLLISDNMEEDSTYDLLEMYAHADMLLYRNMMDSAWILLDGISHQVLSHPLLDDVLLKKAQIRMRQQQYLEADSLLSQLIQMYPDEIITDDALMLRAQLNEQQLNQKDVARQCYEQLILEYPSSIYVDQARQKRKSL
ncbi:MAG: tetratricopeptide repeat protein [Bacteroidales bacterium]|nr:tetratricopeptide repeat protein [Candidatus Colimorpha onthohippi]